MIKNFLLLFLILFAACYVPRQDVDKDFKKHKAANLSIIKLFESNSDSIDISINFKIPCNKIIYKKNDDKFIAKIRNQIMVLDDSSNILLIDKIWYSIDQKYDFNSTRLKDKYITESFRCRIPINKEIKVSAEIIDWSSNSNVWRMSEVFDTSYIEGISDISIFTYDYNGVTEHAIKNTVNKGDSILVNFQYLQNYDVIVDKEFKYSFIQDNDTINKGIVYKNNNRSYYFSQKLDNNTFGELDLVINDDSTEKKIKINIIDDFELWSSNIDDLIGPMEYILSKQQSEELFSMKKNEKIDFIKKFWKNSDPNPETNDNELLIEFIDRINFSNKNFAIIDAGWKSDKGKIYIKYGEPFSIDPPFEDEFGNVYEVWKYENGIQVTFIDRGMFGDYKIYRWN